LDLCKTNEAGSKEKLRIEEMSKLYYKELQLASLASMGKLNGENASGGDHVCSTTAAAAAAATSSGNEK